MNNQEGPQWGIFSQLSEFMNDEDRSSLLEAAERKLEIAMEVLGVTEYDSCYSELQAACQASTFQRAMDAITANEKRVPPDSTPRFYQFITTDSVLEAQVRREFADWNYRA